MLFAGAFLTHQTDALDFFDPAALFELAFCDKVAELAFELVVAPGLEVALAGFLGALDGFQSALVVWLQGFDLAKHPVTCLAGVDSLVERDGVQGLLSADRANTLGLILLILQVLLL